MIKKKKKERKKKKHFLTSCQVHRASLYSELLMEACSKSSDLLYENQIRRDKWPIIRKGLSHRLYIYSLWLDQLQVNIYVKVFCYGLVIWYTQHY